MHQDLVTRLWILLAVSAASLFAFLIWKRSLLGSQQRTLSLQGYQQQQPGILVFTTPDCVPCKKVHRPMIQRLLQQQNQPVQYIEIDATVHPELANNWGVVSVPTTFLLQTDGRSKYVHFGLVAEETLNKQIKELL